MATDVITALVLMDQERKLGEQKIMADQQSPINEFCSGVPLTDETKYVPFNEEHHFKVSRPTVVPNSNGSRGSSS